MVDTLHPPPSVIATWPKPNYVDPATRGPALEYICIIFSVIGLVIVAARVYSRLFITKAPGLDDLLVVLALCVIITLCVLVIVSNKVYHTGRHVWDIEVDTFVGSRLNIWISLWCYIVAISLIKVSVLLFYRRLSVKFSKAFLIATWIGIVYNILYFLAFGLALLLLCHPLHAYWKSFNPVWAATHKYHCVSEGSTLPASSALSVLGDLYSTLLPMVLVYNLDLPSRQKIALYVLFAFGFMAVAAGTIRTVLLYNLLNVDYDFTWELYVTWIWGVIELYLALFAASAPGLKPFFRRFFMDSINSIARNSRKRMDYYGRSNKGTWASETKGQISVDVAVDVERIGVAYGGGGEEEVDTPARERGFLHDIEHEDTKHFELRASRDGKKMIPMQVYKRSEGGGGGGGSGSNTPMNPFVSDRDRSLSSNSPGPNVNWPMESFGRGENNYNNSRTALPNPGMSRTAEGYRSPPPHHVGLVVHPPSSGDEEQDRRMARGGSVKAARMRAQQQAAAAASASISPVGRKRTSIINPRQFEDEHDGLGTGSSLESPAGSDAESIYGEEEEEGRRPWNTIMTNSSRSVHTGGGHSSSSDDTLQLPRMGGNSASRPARIPGQGSGIGYGS
ncbi:uncharacterized protein PV06_02794 [Exophiala oligosperma]|uniref:Rhodopsin domain-containing protein n=1 Tax=Exophiala oligosperma TaxID=215243 RepID=A0A0D2DX22_9EURO|nr:uncharacterized protein PV06_02794 [Exophiala oligosperma]KIW47200.1 hypothetical protein PV06_02794 [Exophiala oligosperma]